MCELRRIFLMGKYFLFMHVLVSGNFQVHRALTHSYRHCHPHTDTDTLILTVTHTCVHTHTHVHAQITRTLFAFTYNIRIFSIRKSFGCKYTVYYRSLLPSPYLFVSVKSIFSFYLCMTYHSVES